MFDHPIRHLWLHLTTRCNFRCGYCYVDQRPLVISEAHAREAVRLLVDSPGQHKVLDLYGGEPLLAGARLWKTMVFAAAHAAERGKTLAVKLATNGSLFRREHLPPLREAGVWVSLSIDGAAATHDALRVDRAGRGTCARVLRGARLLLEQYDRRRVMALLTVHPRHASRLFDDLMALHDEGFRAFHVNPVKTELWTEPHRAELAEGLRRLLATIDAGIDAGDEPIFFEPLSQLLADRRDRSAARCPLEKHLSVLPDGQTALLPDICNEDRLERYRTGPLGALAERFGACRTGSAACTACLARFGSLEAPGMERRAVEVRNRLSEDFATRLLARRQDPRVAAYIADAGSRLFE